MMLVVCKTVCEPSICACSINGIKCQEEYFSFPYGCSSDSCGNPNDRYKYKDRIRKHVKKTVNSTKVKN